MLYATISSFYIPLYAFIFPYISHSHIPTKRIPQKHRLSNESSEESSYIQAFSEIANKMLIAPVVVVLVGLNLKKGLDQNLVPLSEWAGISLI